MRQGKRPTKKATKRPTPRTTVAGLKRLATALSKECAEWRDRANAAEHKLASPEFEDAMDLARRWHYTEVRSLADMAIEELTAVRAKSPMTESEARDWLTRWTDESTDGHNHVIYTGKAVLLLAASDNDGAYESELGESTADSSARAAIALRADVWELLESRTDEWERDDDEDREAPDPTV